MNATVTPLRPAHVRLCVDEALPIVELVRALAAAGLALSNTREGLLIHRMPALKVVP